MPCLWFKDHLKLVEDGLYCPVSIISTSLSLTKADKFLLYLRWTSHLVPYCYFWPTVSIILVICHHDSVRLFVRTSVTRVNCNETPQAVLVIFGTGFPLINSYYVFYGAQGRASWRDTLRRRGSTLPSLEDWWPEKKKKFRHNHLSIFNES